MKRKVSLGLLVFAVLLVAYALVEPYCLTVREVHIVDPDVPESFSGIRIAFLTDIHHGPQFSLARLRKAVEKTNRLQPDIVLLGGDYVYGNPRYIVPCFAELAKLEATMGKFGVLGNHDHWQGAVLTSQSMVEAGIEWINNRARWVSCKGQRIKIGGVGDLWEGSQDITSTIVDTTEEDFVILLSHNPDYVDPMPTRLVDLVLSGHTHGGQVTFFGLWAPFVPSMYGQKYRTGMVDTGLTKVIISNGIGTIPPPIRFFARLEIVLIHLQRGQ